MCHHNERVIDWKAVEDHLREATPETEFEEPAGDVEVERPDPSAADD